MDSSAAASSPTTWACIRVLTALLHSVDHHLQPILRRARGSCVAEELPWLLAICFAPDWKNIEYKGQMLYFYFIFLPNTPLFPKQPA